MSQPTIPIPDAAGHPPAGDPPPVVPPVAPPIPAAAPVIPPVTPPQPDVASLEAKLKETEARHKDEVAKLLEHKKTLEADQKKAAEQKAATRKLLETAGLVDPEAPPTDDPKALLAQHEAAQKEREHKAVAFERTLFRELSRGSLLPKDNDPDLLAYRIGKDAELKALADEGKTAELVAALKEKGYVSVPTGTTAPAPPPPVAPAPKPAAPPSQAAPDARFSTIKTLGDLAAMGPTAMSDFEAKYPDRYNVLLTQHDRQMATARVVSPTVIAPITSAAAR